MSPSKMSQMPTYLKVLIIVMVGAFVIIAAACVVGFMMMKDTLSPGNAAKVANEMVSLPDPLPDGWAYGVGMDVGYQKTANIQNNRRGKHAMIQFNLMKNKVNLSAESMAAKFQMPSVGGMTFEHESKGEEIIGGQKAYYVRQHGTVMGKNSAMEIAFVDFPGGGMLQIQSTEQGRDKFDPELVAPLLKSIKSIGKRSATTD